MTWANVRSARKKRVCAAALPECANAVKFFLSDFSLALHALQYGITRIFVAGEFFGPEPAGRILQSWIPALGL